jgi:fluoride exporter
VTPLVVFIGAGLGGVVRYAVAMLMQQDGAAAFPWATLIVNVTGSLVLGFLYVLLEGSAGASQWRAFLGIGFCGGYTTFSAFSYETVRMLEGGDWNRALVYVSSSVLVCIAATFIGFRLAAMMRVT